MGLAVLPLLRSIFLVLFLLSPQMKDNDHLLMVVSSKYLTYIDWEALNILAAHLGLYIILNAF